MKRAPSAASIGASVLLLVPCVLCKATRDVPCSAPSGKETRPHEVRRRDAARAIREKFSPNRPDNLDATASEARNIITNLSDAIEAEILADREACARRVDALAKRAREQEAHDAKHCYEHAASCIRKP